MQKTLIVQFYHRQVTSSFQSFFDIFPEYNSDMLHKFPSERKYKSEVSL